MERFYEMAHRLLPRLIDCRPIFTRSIIEGAGFDILETEQRSMWGLPVDVVTAHYLN